MPRYFIRLGQLREGKGVRHLFFLGRELLMAQLLYGAGLRLMDCLRLRAKDIAFDLGQIVVRDGKGAKDRITVLPDTTVEPLRTQIETARKIPNAI